MNHCLISSSARVVSTNARNGLPAVARIGPKALSDTDHIFSMCIIVGFVTVPR